MTTILTLNIATQTYFAKRYAVEASWKPEDLPVAPVEAALAAECEASDIEEKGATRQRDDDQLSRDAGEELARER